MRYSLFLFTDKRCSAAATYRRTAGARTLLMRSHSLALLLSLSLSRAAKPRPFAISSRGGSSVLGAHSKLEYGAGGSLRHKLWELFQFRDPFGPPVHSFLSGCVQQLLSAFARFEPQPTTQKALNQLESTLHVTEILFYPRINSRPWFQFEKKKFLHRFL